MDPKAPKPDALAKRPATELSFEEAEQVLHRALELQQSAAGKTSIALAEVENMASELGVSAETVRAAYRDVRSQALVPVSRSRSVLDVVLGDARVVVSRTLTGRRAQEVQRRLAEYLERQLFRVKRDLGDRTVWEPKTGLAHSIQRAVDFSAQYKLPTSLELDIRVAQGADPTETDVVIVAEFSQAQAEAATATGIGFALLAGAGAVAGMLFTPIAYGVGAAFAAGSLGWGRRAYRAERQKATDALELLLDRLERS